MRCATGLIVEQIGDRWMLHILHQLFHEAQRTQALLRQLKGISSRTLSAKLKELESGGWIVRRVYPEVPPRVEYDLTEKGRALEPLFAALKQAGEAVFSDSYDDCPNCRRLGSTEPAPARTLSDSGTIRHVRRASKTDDVVLL
jgi:DNA-binding HxlR family transcriptional regulator